MAGKEKAVRNNIEAFNAGHVTRRSSISTQNNFCVKASDSLVSLL
jgi:hypothetical protein